MPTYRVETNQGTFEIEANREPTSQEIAAFVAQQGGGTGAGVSPAPIATGPAGAPRRTTGQVPSPMLAGLMANPMSSPAALAGVSSSDREAAGQLVDFAAEGGGAAAGQALGATAGPAAPIAIPVGGFIGGMLGDAIAQKRGSQPFSTGRMLGAGVAGAIPGGSLAKAGVKKVATEGLKYAAGNVAGKALETEVDEGRLPTVGEAGLAAGSAMLGTVMSRAADKGVEWAASRQLKALQNSVRDQTLAEARAAGYVIPPSKVNPSPINNLLESIAGKAATAQEAAVRNQEITNALARKAIGAPAAAPLTQDMLRHVRKEAAKPYEEISTLATQAKTELDALQRDKSYTSDPHMREILLGEPETAAQLRVLKIKAGADILALREARAKATAYHQSYLYSKNPDHLETARAADDLAETLEDRLEEAAMEFGKPELVDQLSAARTQIAKTYDVERSLNLSDGNVSAPVLGRSFDRGAPMTGPLKTAGKFQQSFPTFAREGAAVPAPGVNKLKVATALGLGGLGYGAAGPQGLLLGAAPLAEGPVRSLILSPWYQKVMGAPFNGVDHPDFIAQAAQLTTQAAGRKKLFGNNDDK